MLNHLSSTDYFRAQIQGFFVCLFGWLVWFWLLFVGGCFCVWFGFFPYGSRKWNGGQRMDQFISGKESLAGCIPGVLNPATSLFNRASLSSLPDAKLFIPVERDRRYEHPKHRFTSAYAFVHIVGALWQAIPMLTTVLWHIQLKVPPQFSSSDPEIAGKLRKVIDNLLHSAPAIIESQNSWHNFRRNIWNISTTPPNLPNHSPKPQNLYPFTKKVHKTLDSCSSGEECPDEMCPDKPVIQTIFYIIDKRKTSGNNPPI